MKTIYSVILFLMLNLVVSEIQEVNEKQLKEIRKKHKNVLIQFFSHRCIHCKNFIQEYFKLDDLISKLNINVPLLKVNGPENKKLGEQFKVNGYPTILLVQNINGVNIQYKGQRTAEKILEFIKDEISFLSYKTVQNEQQIKEILENVHEFDSINIFYGLKDSKETDNFKKISYLMRKQNAQFYLYEVQSKEEQVLQTHRYQQKQKQLNTKLTITNMKQFIQVNELADLIFLTVKKLKFIDNYINVPTFIVQLSYKDDPLNSQIKRTLKLAKEKLGYKAIITYFYQTDRQLHQQLYLDSNNYDLKIFRMMIQLSTHKDYEYYVIDGEITLENILNAFDNLKKGILKKVPLSENMPPHQQMTVKHLVLNNFNQMTNINNYETLVLFKTDTCGHCKKILPVFQELAQQFLAQGAQIYFGTYDITLNDEVFPIKYVPTLVLYTNGKPKQLEINSKDRLEIIKKIKANSQLVSKGFNFNKILNSENVQEEKQTEQSQKQEQQQNLQELQSQNDQEEQQDVKREDL